MKKLRHLQTYRYLLLLFIISNFIFAQENKNIKTFLLNGEYKKVINVLEAKLSEQDSLSFYEYKSLGFAYQRLMNFSKAIPMLSRANKMQPENLQPLFMLGSCYNSLGKDTQAKLIYKLILEKDSTNLTAMVNLGEVLIKREEYNEASKLYSKMTLADSTNPYYLSQLGICELKKGNKNLAQHYFEESLQVNNGNTKTILRLAKIYYTKQEYDKAKKILKQGLAQNSRSKPLNKMIAEIFYKKKQYEEAIIKYLYLNSIGDTTAQTYQRLGITYYYLSFTKNIDRNKIRIMKLKEAIAALEKSYVKDNDNPVTALYLGLCHKALEEHKTAAKYFEESLDKMFPDYIGQVYKNLAISYEHIKDYKNAILNYKEAIKYLPKEKVLLFYLATVSDRYYKDKKIAFRLYKKFLKSDNNADVKLINYTKERIKILDKDINFWGK